MVDEIKMALSNRQVLNDQRVRRITGSSMKIGTWNVKSIYEAGKVHNVIQEMQRLKVNIMGISETRWANSGEISINGTKIYYSGNNESHHWNGVAILVDKSTSQSVTGFIPISDRVVMIQLQTNQTRTNIIQVYAPTTDKSEEELELFYNDIQQALDITKTRDITIIMGDWNAKIGKGRDGDNIGEFGLGIRNDRGERLAQFCQEKDVVITNTYFKLPERRLYTWKSPADGIDNKIVRNQIDYFLINKRYRNSIKAAKTYPGADVSTDHNPVIIRIEVKFKKLIPKQNKNKGDISQLQDPVKREQLATRINNELRQLETTQNENSNKKWEALKNSISKPIQEILGKNKSNNKTKTWMTDEILQMMEERRLHKNKDTYKGIQREIRKKIRCTKEKWYEGKCSEIEELMSKNDSFNVHKKVKEMCGIKRTNKSNILLDKNGKIIPDINGKLERWKEYIQELFEDERQPEAINEEEDQENGPNITKEEVTNAIKLMKNNRASGPDEIPAEIIKLIEEEQIGILVDLYNTIYNTGIIPKDWLVSTFVAIPKKSNAKECSDHRTVSLMSHSLKIFLKIIHQRVFRKLEQDISETQFGFRNAMGTREALFAFNVLTQRCMDMNQPVYVCFLDYNKAFDRVRHNHLIRMLRQKKLDVKDIRIISNLYFNQTAHVKERNDLSEKIEIQRGVRQGCVLSPMLFNLYSEEIIQRALSEETAGVKVNGRPINNLRFADDTVVIAENMEDLQRLIDQIVESSEENGLTLNIRKTKFMLISKQQHPQENLRIHGEVVEKITKYKHLGTIVNENNDHSEEIRSRIGQARRVFNKMRGVFCTKELSLHLKIRLLRCYVFSVLFYGMEAWTLKKNMTDRMEAFELWAYRRILKISWVQKVTNDEVMRRMKKEREIINTMKIRKLQYLGHVMRGERYRFLQEIMQGKIQGQRSQGRRRISWLNNLRKWFNCSSTDLFRAAISKVRIAMMIANLLRGDGT